MAVATRARAAVPQLLRKNRTFRVFFTGQSISLVGDQVSMLAIPLVAVLVLDAGPAQMGLLGAVSLLPNLLALHAGAWMDRRGRRRQAMLATDVGRGASPSATIPLAYAFDALTMPQLYIVSLGLGALTVLFMVADATLFVSIVEREDYVEASSLLNGSRALSYVGARRLPACSCSSPAPRSHSCSTPANSASALCLSRIYSACCPRRARKATCCRVRAIYAARRPWVPP